MNLIGGTAVVTGGGSGIGRASARALANAGAFVIVSDVAEEPALETVEIIRADGNSATPVVADVTSDEQVAELMARADRDHGLNMLHSNAGVLSGPRFPSSAPRYWRRAFDVNVIGTLLCIHHAVPIMARRGGGAIVVTASIAGLQPHFVDPVYAASKAALVNLTRSLTFLADEAGVRVNAVCPGLVETGLSDNSAAALLPGDQARFHEGRREHRSAEHLSAEAVAARVVRLAEDDGINGMCLTMVAGEPDDLV